MTTRAEADRIAAAWTAVTGDGGSEGPGPAPGVVVRGPMGLLPSAFPVQETAVACVGAALLAAAALHRQRGGSAMRPAVDRSHVAASVNSERHFQGSAASAGSGFAPLSRFWEAADGWVRTHANYPWHRAALLQALGCDAEIPAVGAAIAHLPADVVEERVFAADGIAAAVRAVETWRQHPQGRAVAAEPLVGHEVVGDAPPRRRDAGSLPASGVRVLDLTRVIAGPVCTRYLAALGADVVRLDPPSHPDLARHAPADTLLGKRSALVDLRTGDGAASVRSLLPLTDVVVCGYRPGALDRFRLHPAALAQDHPGLVVVLLSAWGHSGPWSPRRGFDSVVQAPTGIAHGQSADGYHPGALPCQLLDHGTGYLAAAAALDGLRRQRDHGGTHLRQVSLARTAAWLTSGPSGDPGPSLASPASPWLVELDGPGGSVRAVAPPGSLDGRALSWPPSVTGYGDDPPVWPRT